ncbi:hypothetical protein RJ640_001705, partial [Escallonia rubra]
MKTWVLQEVLNEQFVQLEKLEELDSPNFVEEVLTIYFDESAKLITDVEQELNKTPKDFLLMERILHQFKGSSASVGANKVTAAINHLRGCLKERNLELSNAAFQQMKREQDNLKNKLEAYFE